MKALTLTQPWASLVANGSKTIETRSWFSSYRGTLAIHAAKSFPEECRRLCAHEPFFSALHKHTSFLPYGSQGLWKLLPTAAVLCTCRLVCCHQITFDNRPDYPEVVFGDYTPGRFAWGLAEVVPLVSPIPAKGALGLWEWTEPQMTANFTPF